MDNASKALIIAGSIVVTIFLITLATYIIQNNNQSLLANSKILEMDLIQYNKEYELYEGKQKGNNVKELLKRATINNTELYQRQDTIEHCVCIRSDVKDIVNRIRDNEIKQALNGTRWYGVRYPSNINEIAQLIRASQTYIISFKYNDSGYIWEIWINS